MSKWADRLGFTVQGQQTKKAKLAKATNNQLVKQAIATAILFGIIFTLLQFNALKREYDGNITGVIIFLIINAAVFGIFWFFLMRYQRNKARKTEK